MFRNYLKPLAGLVRSAWGPNGLAAHLVKIDVKLDHLTQKIGDLTRQPSAGPRFDVNLLLHQARGAMLREMPAGAGRLLSAGCAGDWYFDWIEQCYGHVPQHFGIEFYLPSPANLPPNVTWIANTAANMEAIQSKTCDLVFSGQNIEHLWREEVAGFLAEAARVLKTGGYLVVDSPNRELTRLLNWSHPEHTIELTVAEIRQLFNLAGFDVTKEVGLWLCRDPKAGRVLPFDPNVADPNWSVTERLVAARQHPEHAFLWWLEGRRNSSEPDRAGIDALLVEAYREAWPERIQRLTVASGWRIDARADGEWVLVPPSETGVVFFGPYMPLRAGLHRVTFDIAPEEGSRGVIAVCDVCTGADASVLQRREVTADMRHVTLEIKLTSQEFGGQFRCFSVAGGFAIRRNIQLEEISA